MAAVDWTHRALVTRDDSYDILPAWFAFVVGGICWGILLVQGIVRVSGGKDIKRLLGAPTESLFVVGLNSLLMGFFQIGAFMIVGYIILGLCFLFFVRDVLDAYLLSQDKGDSVQGEDDKNRARAERIFPRIIFGDSFRDNYIRALTGKVKTLTTSNIYGDFTSNFRRVLLLALAQLILLAMFVSGLALRGIPPFDEQRAYNFYWVGIIVEGFYVAGKSGLEEAYCSYSFFVNALRAAQQESYWKKNVEGDRNGKNGWKRDEDHLLRYNDPFLWLRFILSELTNNIGLVLIMITLPVQLSWSDEPTEFVLNAVAAFYIVELDDLPDSIEFLIQTSTSGDVSDSAHTTQTHKLSSFQSSLPVTQTSQPTSVGTSSKYTEHKTSLGLGSQMASDRIEEEEEVEIVDGEYDHEDIGTA